MRETVDPEFAAYVDAREARWLRSAYLVYGEPERAEEQLLHAFTRLALRWGRVDDPDAFVQRLLYQPALSRWSRPKPFEDDDEQPVKAVLTGLSPVQRTVLVLLHFEELTEFEVAEVLGLSHTAVHGHAQTALSAFRSGLGHGDWRNAEDRR
ncbi:MAG TPA: sigma factor-like helix-turn-helix DNA-binding protein [Kribbella sp.]|uniref:sigma factor-like helix-turn-helix DNA-binding protein n=1 Tax=Kribbella sp. TaxID=1871183 RepID=UPI002D79CFD7|nr:sigma factor-like helix-turn-helix DNA-binding protein [Kribbella sp.]HET6293276.1 sigma factor-like helix-turn-helix DNA-binding protein [Kribbella sp.]